jgi:hypothetical protein
MITLMNKSILKLVDYAYLQLWIRAFQSYDYIAFQSLWFRHEYSFEWKEDPKYKFCTRL